MKYIKVIIYVSLLFFVDILNVYANESYDYTFVGVNKWGNITNTDTANTVTKAILGQLNEKNEIEKLVKKMLPNSYKEVTITKGSQDGWLSWNETQKPQIEWQHTRDLLTLMRNDDANTQTKILADGAQRYTYISPETGMKIIAYYDKKGNFEKISVNSPDNKFSFYCERSIKTGDITNVTSCRN